MRATALLLGLCLLCACSPPGGGTGGRELPPVGTVASDDGVPIAYQIHSTGSPTLLLIHGWAGDQGFWSEQIEPLGQRFGVVTMDLGGHGRSGTERENWTVQSLARDIVSVVRRLDLQRVVLVAHSMGATVALLAVPELTPRVEGIVAVDALYDADAELNRFRWSLFVAALQENFGATCNKFARAMVSPSAGPALVERIAAEMCDGSPQIGVALMHQFPGVDTKKALSAAGVPIVAINSSSSPTNVEGNRAYADFDAVILDDAGHFLMLERPEAFNAALTEAVKRMTDAD